MKLTQNVLLNCRFPSQMLGRIKLERLILLLTLIQIGICSIISSVPLKDFYPEKIEAGGSVLQKSFIPDEDATTRFEYRYTVNLLRVHNLGGYRLSVGYKGMDVYFPVEPTPAMSLSLIYQNLAMNSFQIFLQVSDETLWNFVRSSYIAISNTLGNVYDFYQPCVIDSEMTTGQQINFYYANAAIQPITGSYFTIVSIYKFDPIVQKSAISNRRVKAVVTSTSFTNYTVTISSSGLHIGTLAVIGLIIDPNLINNPKLTNVIMITDFSFSGSDTLQTHIAVHYPGIQFSFENAFFGLYHLLHLSKPNFDFLVRLRSQVQYIKEAETLQIGIYIIVFYKQKCTPPTFLETQTGNCILCPDHCTDCNSTQCFTCSNGFSPSTDKKSCICPFSTVITDICFDFNTGPMKGCVLAVKNQTQILCKACSMPLLMVSKNNECSCKDGFKFDSYGNCFEYCGDGLTENNQCDDGNLEDGDGCSSDCTLETGFNCTVKQTSTICKSELYLHFKLISIIKNQDNSADLLFQTYPKAIPFSFSKQDFDHQADVQKRYSIKLEIDNGESLDLNSVLIQVQKNRLKFRADYNFTIEGMNANLYLNMQNTRYTMNEINYSFQAIGDNQPLKFNGNIQLFVGADYSYLGISIVYMLLLLLGLVAPKYIGLESILTLQLIYYSCLLVIDTEKFPVGFESFKVFQLSTGYNDFIVVTTLLLNSDLESKFFFIGIKKLIVQNYNMSFFLLFISGLAFGISCLVRRSQQNELMSQKRPEQPSNKNSIKQIKSKFQLNLKINEYLFRAYNQISVWSILQIICAISAQMTIGSQSFIVNQKNALNLCGVMFWMLGSILAILAGLNLTKNTMLSLLTIEKLRQRPSEITYKQINFIYLTLVGTIISFFHQIKLWKIYPSLIVTLIHIIYIIILWQIKPYQKSLRVHSVGLFVNQFIYLLFLGFVNLINYLQKIDQIISLGFVYSILFFCVLSLILTFIRLYYEYRYGQKLQILIQRQREEGERKQKNLEQNILQTKTKVFQQQAKQRLNQKLKIRLKNRYLYENQILQDRMDDQIEFWDKRPNFKQQFKENEYFKKYVQKPLKWLKGNQPQEYYKRIYEQQRTRSLERQKIISKYDDPQYQRVCARLKKQFSRKAQKQKVQTKKKEIFAY